MNWTEMAQAEALKFGIQLPAAMADDILWEMTAFPCADLEFIRGQVVEALQADLFAWRVKFPVPVPPLTGKSAYERLLEDEE